MTDTAPAMLAVALLYSVYLRALLENFGAESLIALFVVIVPSGPDTTTAEFVVVPARDGLDTKGTAMSAISGVDPTCHVLCGATRMKYRENGDVCIT